MKFLCGLLGNVPVLTWALVLLLPRIEMREKCRTHGVSALCAARDMLLQLAELQEEQGEREFVDPVVAGISTQGRRLDLALVLNSKQRRTIHDWSEVSVDHLTREHVHPNLHTCGMVSCRKVGMYYRCCSAWKVLLCRLFSLSLSLSLSLTLSLSLWDFLDHRRDKCTIIYLRVSPIAGVGFPDFLQRISSPPNGGALRTCLSSW